MNKTLYFLIALFACTYTYAQNAHVGTFTHYSIPAEYQGKILQVSVDVSIHELSDMIRQNSLFFPAMQVDLGPTNEGEFDGGHIGFQYVSSGEKTINWGGYFREYTTENYQFTPFFQKEYNDMQDSYGTYQVVTRHFDPGTYTQVNQKTGDFLSWKEQHWYRYVVFRGDKKGEYWEWKGFILDLFNDAHPYYMGSLFSKANHIAGFKVWVETDFADNRKFDVRFVYPKCRTMTQNALDLTQTQVIVPEIASLAVAKNPHNTVVAPSADFWKSAARTVWHRNGFAIPNGAYKVERY